MPNGHEPSNPQNERAVWSGPPASARTSIRRLGFSTLVTAFVGLVLLANSYRVESRELAAQQNAEAHGVVVSTVIEGALWSGRQDQTHILVVVRGVERRTSVFADRQRLIRGTPVRVAWAPADPAHIYLVGVRPWTWWAAMRPMFVTVAAASLSTVLTCFLVGLAFPLAPVDDPASHSERRPLE